MIRPIPRYTASGVPSPPPHHAAEPLLHRGAAAPEPEALSGSFPGRTYDRVMSGDPAARS
ncbi:MAG: hypothetical protein QG622_1597, partial [Actinomycetota bacterium]|nr:hypothetical protein [Actinomycetota bacterium]